MTAGPEQILSSARAAVARVIEQLDRDRATLAGKPQFATGDARLSAAKAAAVELAAVLESTSTPETP